MSLIVSSEHVINSFLVLSSLATHVVGCWSLVVGHTCDELALSLSDH